MVEKKKKEVDWAKHLNIDPEMADYDIEDDIEPTIFEVEKPEPVQIKPANKPAQKPIESAKLNPEMDKVPLDALEGAA